MFGGPIVRFGIRFWTEQTEQLGPSRLGRWRTATLGWVGLAGSRLEDALINLICCVSAVLRIVVCVGQTTTRER